MSRGAWLIAAGVAAAAALVWAAAPELPGSARGWAAFLLSVLPALAVIQARLLDQVTDLPRTAVYWSSIVSLWALAAITAVVMATSGGLRDWPGISTLPLAHLAIWSIGTTAGALLLLVAARRLGIREAPLLRHLLPRTAREKVLFVGLSLTAGFCEELVFRAFLIAALVAAAGSLPLALLLSSGVFGLLHAYQRPAGALRAATLGALLALPLIATGSILPAMIAHAAIDIAAGLWLEDSLLR